MNQTHSAFFRFWRILKKKGASRGDFEAAYRLDPEDVFTRGSFLHALAYDGEPEAAAEELKALRESKKHLDLDAWLGNRLAEALRLSGRHEAARSVLSTVLTAPLQRIFDRAFALHIMGSVDAALGDSGRALGFFQSSLENLAVCSKGYSSRIWVLRRMLEAGLGSPAVLNLLGALDGRVISSSVGEGVGSPVEITPLDGSRLDLMVDLGRNEYRIGPRGQLRYGCPLELQLVAWAAVIRPCFPVPRPLVIELLWPEASVSTSYLQGRLSQLLRRVERVYSMPLREGDRGIVRLGESEISRMEVRIHPQGQLPSYFDSVERSTNRGFARHYGISERAAHAHLKQLRRKFG